MTTPCARFCRVLALIATAGLTAASAPVTESVPSDRSGCIALIDRVVLLPNADNPTAIQIWGVFSMGRVVPGFAVQSLPRRGYLYYSINPANRRATLAEWADMRTVAGTGQVIAFGSVLDSLGTIRRESAPLSEPDVFPLGLGIVRATTGYAGTVIRDIACELLYVPAPVSPADGGAAKTGIVRLTARHIGNVVVRYVFEIVGPDNARETSSPIVPAGTETSWTPTLQLRTGESYTWRIWTVDKNWRSQAAEARFVAER